MKANEYFKKHGYRHCKSACMQNGWLNTGFWVQLKRLVESHDRLKEEYGTLKNAKEHLKTINNEAGWNSVSSLIADVESCK